VGGGSGSSEGEGRGMKLWEKIERGNLGRGCVIGGRGEELCHCWARIRPCKVTNFAGMKGVSRWGDMEE